MADLSAARAVLDKAMDSDHVSAIMVGTGFPYEWYSERLAQCERKVKGPNRQALSAACQTANEVALTILDDRLRLTTRADVRDTRPPGEMQLLHVHSFLNGVQVGPLGSDCKALLVADLLDWRTVVLAKRRDDLPAAGPLSIGVVREKYPKLLDRGFEDHWRPGVRVFVLPSLECIRADADILNGSLELCR